MSDFQASDVPQLQFQSKISVFEMFGFMDQPRGMSRRCLYKFIFRFDHAKPKPEAQRTDKNPDCSNEFVGLEHFEVERAARLKMIHAMRPANPPAAGITLEASSTNHVIQ